MASCYCSLLFEIPNGVHNFLFYGGNREKTLCSLVFISAVEAASLEAQLAGNLHSCIHYQLRIGAAHGIVHVVV